MVWRDMMTVRDKPLARAPAGCLAALAARTPLRACPRLPRPLALSLALALILTLSLSFSLALAPAARAERTAAGVWVGQYVCGQGTTALTLSIAAARPRALFHFYPAPSNNTVPEGCFEMESSYDADTGRIALTAGAWISRPDGYVTVDLEGQVSADGGTMTGKVIGPYCETFALRRVAVSSPRAPGTCQPLGMVLSPERRP